MYLEFPRSGYIVYLLIFRRHLTHFDDTAVWYKLVKYGIKGKVIKVTVSMYDKIKSCVFLNGKKSDCFSNFKGVLRVKLCV